MNTLMLSHFHKDFPFNHDSSWVTPCYAGGTGPYEWHPPGEGNYKNINFGKPSIMDLQHYYRSVPEENFLRAIGAEATTYWLLKHANDFEQEYIGTTSYRRYLLLNNPTSNETKVFLNPSVESSKLLTDDAAAKTAEEILSKHDMIITKQFHMDTTVEQQYLMFELPEYWELFKEGIVRINPSYKKNIDWFITSKTCNFEAVSISRKDIFKRMMGEYFEVMEYIWKNCSEVFPDKNVKSYACSEPLPWRYPGFLNERFVPFFVHANNLNTFEVPLALLQ